MAHPWRHPVRYLDPSGRFAARFPARPRARQKLDSDGSISVTIHILEAKIDDEWSFSLSWSDAPPETPLVDTQEIRPDTPASDAARDHGKVFQRAKTKMFGRDALEFVVRSDAAGSGYYRDARVVLGGRLYELTVSQPGRNRRVFDRFVSSFRLLEPPRQRGADFFARAAELCAAKFATLPDLPDDATSAQHGQAVMAVADVYSALVDELSKTPASARDQGDAAAFIDTMRRSIEPGRRFARAVSANAPNMRALGRATHGDSDLTTEIAERHHASSCA